MAATPSNGIVFDDELAPGGVAETEGASERAALVERGDQTTGAGGARLAAAGAHDRAEHGSVPDRQGVVVGGLVLGRAVGEDTVGVGDVLQAERGEGL